LLVRWSGGVNLKERASQGSSYAAARRRPDVGPLPAAWLDGCVLRLSDGAFGGPLLIE